MAKLTVKKSYTKGCVKLAIALSAHGYRCDNVKVDATCDMSAEEAKALAAALVAEADRTLAAVAKEQAAKARREQWRQREIAAGRMVSMTPADFLNRVTR